MSTQKQLWTIIYDSARLIDNKELSIIEDEHHYIANVLRLKVGDEIEMTNCRASKMLGRIDSITKKEVKVTVLKAMYHDKILPEVHLYLAMPKPSTLEEVVSSASEIGVDEIHIFRSEKCASKAPVKLEKLERISNEAVRVSKSASSAKIFYYGSLEELLEKRKLQFQCALNLFCDESHVYERKINNSLLQIVQEKITKQKPIHLIIGPEASFSDTERVFIHKNIECIDVSLGSNILRVPNAVLLAVGVVTQTRELLISHQE